MEDSTNQEHALFSAELLSEFHDSELVSVELQRGNKSLVLGFETANNKLWKFQFSGVVVFRIADVIQQNVVSRVLTVPGHPFTAEQLTYWINWASSVSNSDQLLAAAALKSISDKIQKGELLLFVLEPSWGAEAAIICNSIEVL